jgi:hypothetical protein
MKRTRMKKMRSKIWSVPSLSPRSVCISRLECRMSVDRAKALSGAHHVTMLIAFYRILCLDISDVLPCATGHTQRILVSVISLVVGFLRNISHD